jgi:hypothetical protein
VPPLREMPVSRASFYVSLGLPNICSADRNISPFSRSPWERSIPSCSPKRGPYGKMHSFPQPYLTSPSEPPVKESLSRFPKRPPVERYDPCPEPSFIYLGEVRSNISPIVHKICTAPLHIPICFKGTCVFSWRLNLNWLTWSGMTFSTF